MRQWLQIYSIQHYISISKNTPRIGGLQNWYMHCSLQNSWLLAESFRGLSGILDMVCESLKFFMCSDDDVSKTIEETHKLC